MRLFAAFCEFHIVILFCNFNEKNVCKKMIIFLCLNRFEFGSFLSGFFYFQIKKNPFHRKLLIFCSHTDIHILTHMLFCCCRFTTEMIHKKIYISRVSNKKSSFIVWFFFGGIFFVPESFSLKSRHLYSSEAILLCVYKSLSLSIHFLKYW